MPFQRYVLQGDLTAYIQRWTGTLSKQVSGGSGNEQRLFPFLSPTVQNDYEYGGALNGTVTKTTSTTYSYGDGFGNLTQVATSITDKDSSSPYFNLTWQSVVNNTYLNDNTSVWCLGLPTVTTVQNSAPSQTTQTRTYNYTPDSNHALCREQQQIIEPSTAPLTVTTDLQFDSCGNINSIKITGHNPDGSQMPSPRQTTVDYGTRCQLPELVTNALIQKTKFGYRYDFGLVNQVTDPNNVVASRAYDDFGRISQVTRADGTYSIYTPYLCSTGCGGPPDLRFSVYRDDYGTDGIKAYSDGLYWDGLGRQRYDITTHAFGRLVYDEVVLFDSLGRRTAQYQPFASSPNGYLGFLYDPLNRLDAARLIRPDNTVDRTVTIGYGGRTVQMNDTLSHTETYISDVMGRLRQVKDPPSSATTL